jgi:hypothetical protein
LVARVPLSIVTAADLGPAGIAVRNYLAALVFPWSDDRPVVSTLEGKSCPVSLGSSEAIAQTLDGRALYSISEGKGHPSATWSSDASPGSCQDHPMSGTVAEPEPEPRGSQLGDAVLDTMRGALRILGGMVQMAAAVTRVLAVAVLKAATAAEKAVEASEEDERKADSEPKPRTKRPVERGSS